MNRIFAAVVMEALSRPAFASEPHPVTAGTPSLSPDGRRAVVEGTAYGFKENLGDRDL